MLLYIFLELNQGNSSTFTMEEFNTFWNVEDIEKRLMLTYDIFDCTVGACIDPHRLPELAKKTKIGTVLLDEAGQLLHAKMIHLMPLNAARYIIIGDPQQLPPQMQTREAETAGLERSFIDMIQLSESLATGYLKLTSYRFLKVL